MAIDFEAIKAKAIELTNTGVAKAKELSEIGKLKVQNISEQDEIRRAYLEIGKRYFEQHGENPEEGYAELCRKVAESKAKIDYNNERIADIKTAGNLSDEEIDEVLDDENTPEL